MYLLVPVIVYNQFTNKEEDVVMSLVDLSPMSITSIDEIKEDKDEEVKEGVLISYKSGDSKEIRIPFMDLLDLLNQNGLVNFGAVQHCIKYNEELKKRLDLGNKLLAQDRLKNNNNSEYYKP